MLKIESSSTPINNTPTLKRNIWSFEEDQLLLRGFMDRRRLLQFRSCTRESSQEKKQAWNEISEVVNTAQNFYRDGQQCRNRYDNLKKDARKYLIAVEEAQKGDGTAILPRLTPSVRLFLQVHSDDILDFDGHSIRKRRYSEVFDGVDGNCAGFNGISSIYDCSSDSGTPLETGESNPSAEQSNGHSMKHESEFMGINLPVIAPNGNCTAIPSPIPYVTGAAKRKQANPDNIVSGSLPNDEPDDGSLDNYCSTTDHVTPAIPFSGVEENGLLSAATPFDDSDRQRLELEQMKELHRLQCQKLRLEIEILEERREFSRLQTELMRRALEGSSSTSRHHNSLDLLSVLSKMQ